jgi:hypothetical protein
VAIGDLSVSAGLVDLREGEMNTNGGLTNTNPVRRGGQRRPHRHTVNGFTTVHVFFFLVKMA